MDEQRGRRRSRRCPILLRRLSHPDAGDSHLVSVPERRSAASCFRAASPSLLVVSPFFAQGREASPRFSPAVHSSSACCQPVPFCFSSVRTSQTRLTSQPLVRFLSGSLFFFLCILECLSFAAEARVVVVYPDTLTSYPPILETYFAPWSANFTSVSGRLRYFTKTCDLEHYFYRDVSDLEADPSSLFKELRALHFFPPDRPSAPLAQLDARDGPVPFGAPRSPDGDTSGQAAGLFRGAFRRLQEVLLPQILTSLPWGTVNSQEARASSSVASVDATGDGGGAHPGTRQTEAADGVSSERGSRPVENNLREDRSAVEAGADNVKDSTSRRPAGFHRPTDDMKRDTDLSPSSETDFQTLHSLASSSSSPPSSSVSSAPSSSSFRECSECTESRGASPEASWISQWAFPGVSFFGDVTHVPLASPLPAAHYVLSRRGLFSHDRRAPVADSSASSGFSSLHALLAMDSSTTPSFLFPAQPSHLSTSATLGVSEPRGRRPVGGETPGYPGEPAREANRQRERSEDSSSPSSLSSLWRSLFGAARSSLSASVSKVRFIPTWGEVASTRAGLSPGRPWLFEPLDEERKVDSSPAGRETDAAPSRFSSFAAWSPVEPQAAALGAPAAAAGAGGSSFAPPELRGAGGDTALSPSEEEPVRFDFRGQVLWFFDQCNNPEDVQRLVHAANTNGAGALIFTNTTFAGYGARPSLSSFEGWKKLVTSVPGPPQPRMPVLSVPDTRLSREIKSRLRAGDVVEVDVDMLPADYVNCAVLEPVKWASLVFVPLWGTLTLLWYTVCNCVHTYEVSPLHRLLLLPPLLKTTFMVTAFGFYAQCPNYLGASTQYILMAYMGLNTIFNTIFYGILLLLAKGFMVTREAFGRKESLSLAVLVSLVYIVTSVNQVEEAETLPALLFLYVALMATVLMSAARNIRHLELRLAYVRLVQVQDWEEALNVKLEMFQSLYRFAAAFFFLQILQKLFVFELLDRQDLSEISGSALEWIFFIGIAAVFRPREEIRYFSLMQRTPETHTILPMYAAGPYAARVAEGGEERLFEGDPSVSLLAAEPSEPLPSVWTRMRVACCRFLRGLAPGLQRDGEAGGRSSEEADGVAVDMLPCGEGTRPRGSPIVILNPAAEEEEPTGYLSLHNLAVGTLVPTPRKLAPDEKRNRLSNSSEQSQFRRVSLSAPSQQNGESRPASAAPSGDSSPPEPSA
ncbi:putative transmembrane protein [Toxoplasma gondii p89]|uniref:Putative transmembrane protein n=1 Tax=Toxoplasma gondii p89 TaxID=943119 RepID=A0A086KQD3_TOXGO|nr:putative transmembrane protein [Toxoplasma gondii p89]